VLEEERPAAPGGFRRIQLAAGVAVRVQRLQRQDAGVEGAGPAGPTTAGEAACTWSRSTWASRRRRPNRRQGSEPPAGGPPNPRRRPGSAPGSHPPRKPCSVPGALAIGSPDRRQGATGRSRPRPSSSSRHLRHRSTGEQRRPSGRLGHPVWSTGRSDPLNERPCPGWT
jgi:hypothetical protein